MSLLDNLVAHWSLDEVSGTRYDSTSNNHDLADNNTVLYETGKVGRAAKFSAATSEFLSMSDHADVSLDGTSYTIMFWAKVTDLGTVGLISKRTDDAVLGSGANEFTIFHEFMSGFSKFSLFVNDLNAYVATDLFGLEGIGASEEYFFGCFRFDLSATEMSIFHEETVTTSPFTRELIYHTYYHPDSIPDASAPLRLGTSNGSGHFLEGGMDEVAIWRRALSDLEVNQLYNEGNGLSYPWGSTYGSDMDWTSSGSLESIHRRHRTPDRTHPVFVNYDYSWSGFLNDKFLDVPDITDWGSPPEVPVLPREHRRAPYRAYSQEDSNIYPDVSDWWLQASEPVMPRKGTGERAYWESGQERDSASGEPSIPTTNPGVSSPSSATGGGDDTIIPPIAEPSIDGKEGLYIPERPDLEDTLRPRVDDPE